MKNFFCSKILTLFVVLTIVAQSVSFCLVTFAEAESNSVVSETENFLKAYPGAEGFGQTSKGGRGGQVYHVTNLDCDGPGSLTYGLEFLSGPRTIVFDVGGVIDLTNFGRAIHIKGENGSNVTVAGQTAPYPGITVKGYGFEIENAHDIIIRNIRVRIGGVRSDDEYYVSDPLVITASKRVIVDHCSMQWGVDCGFNITGEDITLSNNIFDKQLILNSSHEKAGHSYAGMVKEGSKAITFAKNFVGDSTQRSPRFADVDCADVYNNILYNCGNGIESYNYEFQNRNIRLNVYNNFALRGPNMSNATLFRVGRGRDYSGGIMTYFKDNYKQNSVYSAPTDVNIASNLSNSIKKVLNFGSDNNMAGTDYDLSSVTFDEWNDNPASYDNNGKTSPAATLTYMEYPFAAPRAEVMEVVAEDGTNNLVGYAVDDNGMGATRPARDLYDTMIMKELQLGETIKASLDESEVTPFFEELERRTGNDYTDYKTTREWYIKQGDGPVLNGASNSILGKPVKWDDYTDVNVNTNSDAASKYESNYTTTFEVGDWWGEYCGAPGQVMTYTLVDNETDTPIETTDPNYDTDKYSLVYSSMKYTEVGRTVADLYPDEWMQKDFPEVASAMDKYRTDNYAGQADSASIVWDSAEDGIPDWYKVYKNLDIQTDYSRAINSETGYTYLEEYLSLMAGDKETAFTPVSIENFKVNNISYSAAQVFWNTDYRASCTIEYGTEPGQYTESKTLAYKNVDDGLETYHVVALNRLEADTQYYYKVTAEDENGMVSVAEYDANNETTSGMTFKTSPLPEGDLLPNKPVITNVVPYTGQVDVIWSGNINDEAYEIYYDTEDHGCDYTEYANKIDNIGARDRSYTVTGLTDSTRYYFVVAAVNMHGKSPSASASAVPERRFFHYDFTQMTEEEQKEFLKDEFIYDLGGSVTFQKDPDTGKNVLQLLDETNSHGVYVNFKLPLVQSQKFTYEIKMKNLYQKQTDALNNQQNILYNAADEKNYIQLSFYNDLLFEDNQSRKPSDLFDSAFDLRLESVSEPISTSEGRFDGTRENGAIWLDDIETPIGSYSPGCAQGTEFEGEKVLPEGYKYPESRYMYTSAYGDAKYSNFEQTDKTTNSIWYYEKNSAQYVTYRIVADPESSVVKVYTDDVLLYDNKVSDFSNIGKFQIKSRNDGYSWTNIESISVYAGEDRLNIPELPPEPEHESTVAIGGADGLAGDEVVMPVKIENNIGMTGFNIELSYDNSKLIPTGIVQATDLPGELKAETRVPGYVTAKWKMNQRVSEFDSDGELFMVKFRLADSVEQGEEIPINFSEVRIKDQYNNLVGVDKIGSSVSATESTWSIKECSDGKVVVTAPNNAAEIINPSLYIAKYETNGDVLDDMEIISVPVVGGKTEYELTTEKNLSPTADSYVQLMLWDGNMAPLCSPLIERYTADQDDNF